jgi:hypothetical protein
VTDPRERNIADQRYTADAELRYLAGTARPRTHAQWLDYFRDHYETYTVAAPSAPGGQWQATALSDQHDELFGWSATELLDELTEHRSRKPHGQMRLNSALGAGPQSAPRQSWRRSFCERPFPQPCRGVHRRRLLI